MKYRMIGCIGATFGGTPVPPSNTLLTAADLLEVVGAGGEWSAESRARVRDWQGKASDGDILEIQRNARELPFSIVAVPNDAEVTELDSMATLVKEALKRDLGIRCDDAGFFTISRDGKETNIVSSATPPSQRLAAALKIIRMMRIESDENVPSEVLEEFIDKTVTQIEQMFLNIRHCVEMAGYDKPNKMPDTVRDSIDGLVNDEDLRKLRAFIEEEEA